MPRTRGSLLTFNLVFAAVILVAFSTTTRAQASNPITDPSVCVQQAVRLQASQLSKLIVKRLQPAPEGLLDKSTLRGSVTVEVCVDEQGKVVSVKALSGSPAAFQSVIESVRQWGFRVYKRGGLPQAVSGRIKVNFNFQSRASGSDPSDNPKPK